MLNACDTSKPVMFGLEDPVGVIEWLGTAGDWQRLELRQCHSPSFYNCKKLRNLWTNKRRKI